MPRADAHSPARTAHRGADRVLAYGPARSRPMSLAANPASLALLVLTLAVSLAGLYANPRIIEANLFRPARLRRGRDWHTAVTSGFIHGEVGHGAVGAAGGVGG